MRKTNTLYATQPVNMRLPVSIKRELDQVTDITGQTTTDAVIEALRYWLNAQSTMLPSLRAEESKGGAQ